MKRGGGGVRNVWYPYLALKSTALKRERKTTTWPQPIQLSTLPPRARARALRPSHTDLVADEYRGPRGDEVVEDPVQAERRGHAQREPANHQGQKLKHLCFRIN